MTELSLPNGAPKFFGYSLVYFDTNIYSILVRHPESWKPLRDFMIDRNLLLGVSAMNVLELSDVTNLHEDLARFLLQIPSALLKPANRIIDEEPQACLQAHTVNPLLRGALPVLTLQSDDPTQDLREQLFQHPIVRQRRAEIVQGKPAFVERIRSTHDNFLPIVEPDRYTEADGPLYALQLLITQILPKSGPAYAKLVLQALKTDSEKAIAMLRKLQGLWLFSLAQFYRYYLHRRKPSGNDYGDFQHVVPIPYCQIAIVENSLAQELQHIKREDPVLSHTNVYTAQFLRQLTGLPLN